MNPKHTLIAAVAICSAAGFLVGRVSPKSKDADSRQDHNMSTGPRAGSGATDTGKAPRGLRPVRQVGFGQDSISNIADHDDLRIRLSLILNHPDAFERSEAWLRLVKGLSSEEIAIAVSAFRDGTLYRSHRSEYSMLLHAWVKIDPYAAIDSTGSTHSKRRILSSWAATDPDSALYWVKSQHNGKGPNPWMPAVIQGLASIDPKLATQLMMELPHPGQRAMAMNAIQKHYLRQDPETARNWALSISDKELRDDAIAKIAEGQAQMDPMGAANWLLANPGEGAIQGMDQVMERMTLTDSQSAIGFMETISDPSLKSRALEGIANELSSIDPHATLALIDAHPNLVNDEIVRELIWGARTSEPELGANAIARIQSDYIRNRTYLRYISQWAQKDREAAAAWLNQNQLPTDNREALESLVRERNGNETSFHQLDQPGRPSSSVINESILFLTSGETITLEGKGVTDY